MTIKIGFWNINGLGKKKCKEEDFIKIINGYEIICLTETWGSEDKSNNNFIIPPGYKAFHHNRKNKHKKARRNSGGILILYKKELHNYLKVKNREYENILWITMDKSLLMTDNNLIIGAVYISPINSSIYNRDDNTLNCGDTYSYLYKQIATFNEKDAILVGGDCNARTGKLEDFIVNDEHENKFLSLPESFISEQFSRARVNQDRKVNKFGYELRDICIAANLKILNGRTLGDLTGKYTYIGNKGCSTVDYILASENIMSEGNDIINNFRVEELNMLSDHRPVTVSLHNFNNIKIKNISKKLVLKIAVKEKELFITKNLKR